jgi:hypothetical protein
VYSMIYGVISLPVFFISVTFGLLRAIETHRLAVIYSVFFSSSSAALQLGMDFAAWHASSISSVRSPLTVIFQLPR